MRYACPTRSLWMSNSSLAENRRNFEIVTDNPKLQLVFGFGVPEQLPM